MLIVQQKYHYQAPVYLQAVPRKGFGSDGCVQRDR